MKVFRSRMEQLLGTRPEAPAFRRSRIQLMLTCFPAPRPAGAAAEVAEVTFAAFRVGIDGVAG